MMKIYNIVFFILLFSISCNSNKNKEIEQLLNSNKKEDIVYCCYLIGEQKKTDYLEYLFKNIQDERVSHDIRFKGMSIYQGCAIALKKISGLDPPNKITYKKDTVIISFYNNWAIQNKYLNNKK